MNKICLINRPAGFGDVFFVQKIVSFYITQLSSNSKVSTLKRRLASISVIHKLKGYYIDIKHPLIIENLMGIKRKKGIKSKSIFCKSEHSW